MAVVLAIIGVLAVFLIPTVNVMLSNKTRSESLQKLKNIETAIYNYAIVNRRLPCPANGLLTVGTEAITGSNCTSNQLNGVVPWATIGLSYSDILDGWNNQITYRIAYGLSQASALDMSSCDPAGTANSSTGTPGLPAVSLGLCASTCTGTFAAANCTSPQNFLTQKGLDVSNGATKIMDYTKFTGAGFILISHGDNGYGAINGARVYQSSAITGTAGTTLEAANLNQASLVVTSNAPPVFVDATFSDASDATTYFDDIIIRPSLMSVINTVQLGPRSH
jgi:type II secretory pathway pseudopilin PulG